MAGACLSLGSRHRRGAQVAGALLAVAAMAFLFSTLACGGVTPGTTSLPVTSVSSVSSTDTTGSAVGTAGDWPTYHHDAARSAISSDQAALGRVKQTWTSAALDGALYAQPLVVGDTVIAATESDSVYALSATSGATLWRANLGSPVPGSELPCGNIDPSGITGTPVVDVAGGIIYAVAFLHGGPHHELFALDLATGKVRWHLTVDPPGLSALVEQQRGALALTGGRVYVPFGGLYGDCGQYKGAVVSVPAGGSGALTSYEVPTSRMAGIWNPGGLLVDPSGDLWAVTGNSESQSSFDYGNSVLRLSPSLKVLDYFAPGDWARLNAGDLDLSSLDPVLLPGGLVLAVGKTGTAYLLDAGNLGHVGTAIATTNIGSSPFGTAAVLGARVFVPCTGDLIALDTSATGLRVAWKVAGRAGAPIVAAGHVWYLGYDGVLRAVDPVSGSVAFTLELTRPVSRFVTPSAANGRLFVADGAKITAVSLR